MDVLDVLMNLFRLKCWIEADLHFLYFVSPRHWRPTTPSILVHETSAVYFSINHYSSHKIVQWLDDMSTSLFYIICKFYAFIWSQTHPLLRYKNWIFQQTYLYSHYKIIILSINCKKENLSTLTATSPFCYVLNINPCLDNFTGACLWKMRKIIPALTPAQHTFNTAQEKESTDRYSTKDKAILKFQIESLFVFF